VGLGPVAGGATSSPPPRHNFVSIPRIRSESPAFDLHHPEIAAMEMAENGGLGDEDDLVDAPNVAGRSAHLDQQKGDTDR
jgi:cytochrome c oxidase subunit 1